MTRLGSRQRDLLVQLSSVNLALPVGDQLSASLVRRGLLIAEPDGSFARMTAQGFRILADEIDAGRVKLFDPAMMGRKSDA